MSSTPLTGKRHPKFLMDKFKEFITIHSPEQVSRHLRCILLDYMSHQLKTGLPADFHVYLWELYDLFNLLDQAADEYHQKKPLKTFITE
jgi:hypothetical protein